MIYGNHNKRRGDIVKIARWDEEVISIVETRYLHESAGDIEFIIIDIDHYRREIVLRPSWIRTQGVKKSMQFATYRVLLDDTNLIRVGRLAEM